MQAWNDASNVSFNTGDARPLAAVIGQGVDPNNRLAAEAAQMASALSPDGRLVYAALAEKIERQMVKLPPEDKVEMRRLVADGLLRREAQEGPVALSKELRRLATGSEAKQEPDRPEPEPPKRKRRLKNR